MSKPPNQIQANIDTEAIANTKIKPQFTIQIRNQFIIWISAIFRQSL